jgi:hypothetical protein
MGYPIVFGWATPSSISTLFTVFALTYTVIIHLRPLRFEPVIKPT